MLIGATTTHGPQNAYEWAVAYRRLEGRPFSLDAHRPLRAIYLDDHPHIVIGKPAQRGVSELAINQTAFALDRGAEVWTGGAKNGLNVAYIFPKKESLGDFSKERLSGLARETPYLTTLFEDDEFNAVTFKQVRDSYLYLRGGWSTSALKSFPADVLMLDEYDEMARSAIALARRRLNASQVRREMDISTPSVPGQGIHQLYLESDRHVYQQLHRCGEWVTFDLLRDLRCDGQAHDVWGEWPAEQIRRVPIMLVCPACNQPVSTEERLAEGRWQAEAPDVVGLRGYWIPQLSFPVVDLTRLAAAAVNPDPFEREQFFQSDLGVPYAVSGSKITLEMLLQLPSPLENGRLPTIPPRAWKNPTLGIDVGAKWHWKASAEYEGQRYTLAVGAADNWDQVDALMRHFRVRMCVIDALPELDGCKQFAQRWRGRVMRAFYPGPTALKGQLWHVEGLDLQKLGNKKKRRRLQTDVVQINRTMVMDRVWNRVHRVLEPAPLEVVNNPELRAHLQAPTRTVLVDTKGESVPAWVHVLPDHLYHAYCYDLVAAELLPPAAAATFSGAAAGSRGELTPPQPGRAAGHQPTRPSARLRGAARRSQLRTILSQARAGQMQTSIATPWGPRTRRPGIV